VVTESQSMSMDITWLGGEGRKGRESGVWEVRGRRNPVRLGHGSLATTNRTSLGLPSQPTYVSGLRSGYKASN